MKQESRGSRERVAMRLHSVAIHLLREVRKQDTLSGFTPARASVLSILVFGGARTIGELAAAEQVSLPTVSKLVKGLEHERLVERRYDPEDARRTKVFATAAARRRMEAARARRVDALTRLLERGLTAEEWKLIENSVTVLESALQKR